MRSLVFLRPRADFAAGGILVDFAVLSGLRFLDEQHLCTESVLIEVGPGSSRGASGSARGSNKCKVVAYGACVSLKNDCFHL